MTKGKVPATKLPKDTIIINSGALEKADSIVPDSLAVPSFFFYKSNLINLLSFQELTYLARELTSLNQKA